MWKMCNIFSECHSREGCKKEFWVYVDGVELNY